MTRERDRGIHSHHPTKPDGMREYAGGEVLARACTIGLPDIEPLKRHIDSLRVYDPNQILAPANEIDQMNKAAQQLQQAHTVIFNADFNRGIGDSVIALRFARIAAKNMPDKEFTVVVHPALQAITSLTIPSNVKLVSELPLEEIANPSSFLFNSPDTEDFPELKQIRGADRYVERNPMSLDVIASLAGDHGPNDASAPTSNIPFTRLDLYFASWLIGMGMPITQKDIEESLLKKPEIEANKVYDIVIAPDAAEQSVNGKSKKSLPVPVWKAIFMHLKHIAPELKIGILQGTSHPDYCAEVYKAAAQVYDSTDATSEQVNKIDTNNLNDFILLLNQTSKFVGMDSGLTHLAQEFAVETPLIIRQIFSLSSAVSGITTETYGIRGIGQRGEIFSITRKDQGTNEPDYQDMEEDLAAFIAA